MKLNLQSLGEISADKSILTPRFDIQAVRAATAKEPQWLHIGAGNIFRGFIAGIAQTLLNAGELTRGIIAADSFDGEIIDKIYKPFDNLTLNVSLCSDGTTKSEVTASVCKALKADPTCEADIARLKEIARSPSLEMISFTITEKGYAVTDSKGELLPAVKSDIASRPGNFKHAMSFVAWMMYERYLAGKLPVALVSMDNCSHNGEKLRSAVMTIAAAWEKAGLAQIGFTEYLSDETKVSFPWSMIDKITPRPSEKVMQMLMDKGFEGMEPIVTSKNTYIAPFVNAEEPQYLVIEDKFPNHRPALEKAGVYMTDRETVNKTERMKVTTCLNPLHTALAVYGCLLGYTLICDEMKDPQLVKLVNKLGYDEGLKVVTDPGIISPEAFIDEVVSKRLPNPFMPDTPQRIATDTSQKVGIRFGETIRSYAKIGKTDKLVAVPLAIAGWLRYLLGIDDGGNRFEISSDPLKDELCGMLSGIRIGEPSSYCGQLRPILSNSRIFGSDLVSLGMDKLIEEMFISEIEGTGAVRNTLKKYLDGNK